MGDLRQRLAALDRIDPPEVWDRAASMEPIGDVPDPSFPATWQRRVSAGVVAAAVFAGAVALAVGALGPNDRDVPVGFGSVPIEQESTIRRVIEAAERGDVDGLAASFTRDGTLNAHAAWGAYPIREVAPTWIENVDAWGLDVVVRSCAPGGESSVRCDVHTRWRTLQMEMVERWDIAFEGRRMSSLVMVRSDLDPVDRTMPLGFHDLDSWESWLEDTHPAQARKLLPDDEEERLFAPFLRYDPTLADEIAASIDEYLNAR
jgi:hypothetical protein